MQSIKKASEVEVDKTSASISKAGPSKQPDPTTRVSDPTTWASKHSDAQPMDTDLYGPSLPPRFTQSVQSDHGYLDPHSKHLEQPKRVCSSRAKKHSDKKKHKVRAKYYSQSSSSEEDQSSAPVKKSNKPQQAPEQDQQQDNTDSVFYRKVDMSDLPSQYAEEVETFKHILDLPDPRGTLPLPPGKLLLYDEKGQQELRPRGPSAMLPLNPILKDAFEKFEQDFLDCFCFQHYYGEVSAQYKDYL